MSNPIIEIKNISAGYDSKNVLNNISLTVMDDDYLGIIGPNGGGKTTLVKVILGLKKISEGDIIFYKDGIQVKGINVGYLPQYNDIDRTFPISVYDVILSGLSRKKKLFHKYTQEQKNKVFQTIKKMDLFGLSNNPINALSGGQLQRVLLARAIVSDPDVLILDEPNTYIDKHFQEQMYDMLKEINRKCAIIIVSHDLAEIEKNAKRIAYINKKLKLKNSNMQTFYCR